MQNYNMQSWLLLVLCSSNTEGSVISLRNFTGFAIRLLVFVIIDMVTFSLRRNTWKIFGRRPRCQSLTARGKAVSLRLHDRGLWAFFFFLVSQKHNKLNFLSY